MKEIEEYLTPKKAASMTGYHAETIRRWCRQGDLEHTKIRGQSGHEYRFSEDALYDCIRLEDE